MSDIKGDAGFITAEEQEVARDEAAMPETAEEAPEEAVEDQEPAKTEYIEFVGLDPQYGTEFHSEHSITKSHFKKYHDLTTPKDLVWTKGSNGRFLVPTADMTPEVAEVLAKDPAFKRVTV